MLRINSGLGSDWKPGPARGSGLGSGICARLGSEPSSTHLGLELYSELALVRLSSDLELGSCGASKKCRFTDELQVTVNISTWPVFLGAKMLFLIRLAWEASETHCFHRICSEPLKPLVSVLGSEFGSAWLGARPGWTPDRCSA